MPVGRPCGRRSRPGYRRMGARRTDTDAWPFSRRGQADPQPARPVSRPGTSLRKEPVFTGIEARVWPRAVLGALWAARRAIWCRIPAKPGDSRGGSSLAAALLLAEDVDALRRIAVPARGVSAEVARIREILSALSSWAACGSSAAAVRMSSRLPVLSARLNLVLAPPREVMRTHGSHGGPSSWATYQAG